MTAHSHELPRQLLKDTNELMTTLDRTVANLREFTDRLRAATDASRLEES